jgi:MYXO-CTERM domain-containing protein
MGTPHRRAASYALAARVLVALVVLAPARTARGQATCVDATGDACLAVVRAARADGVIDDIFVTRDGLYAPQLRFATYIRGVNGCFGRTDIPTILEGYRCTASGIPEMGPDPAPYANSLDWYWTQILRTNDAGAVVADGAPGFYEPTRGRIYDLGGEANRVVLFPITDHPPLPCEAFEYSVWLSNDPDARETASPDAPDPRKWNPARLIRVFTQGWTRNPRASGAAEADRGDLGTWLRDTSAGDAVADALVTVWALPCGLSFRYVSIQAGNYGNPGPECVFHSSDDELDAVAGLNEDDTAICVDADGDGHRAASCGGGDCDDADPTVHPGAFEPCDSPRDLDCQPALECPTGTRCDGASGLCVSTCFEGGCADGFTCTPEGLCTETACALRAEPCPAGTICRGGECRAPCEGVVCPRGQVCAGGACIDPCAGVVCPTNQVCIAGRPGAATICGPACTCTELAWPLCPGDTACDAREGSPTRGRCVDPGCETASCAMPREACERGVCVDACEGVVCPVGQRCTDGACVPDRCASIRCPSGQICREGACIDACDVVTCAEGERCVGGACVPDPCAAIDCGTAARCIEGMCVPNEADSGPAPQPMDGGPMRRMPPPGGCCRVAGGGGDAAIAAVALIALLGLVLWRRRRGARALTTRVRAKV